MVRKRDRPVKVRRSTRCVGSGLTGVPFGPDDGKLMCAVCPFRAEPVNGTGTIPDHEMR